MEDNLLCSCVCVCVSVSVCERESVFLIMLALQRSFCSSNATSAIAGVIQGEPEQFPPSLSLLSVTYIHVAGSS